MRDTTFFSQIVQKDFESEGFRFCTPAFYYDTTSIQVNFMAPIQSVKALLPSPRMVPLPVTFRSTLVMIAAYQYHDCDIGPYNEIAISFPVTLDRPATPFFGLQQFLRDPYIYIWQLPVTTEIARYGGVVFYNFPKFIADIDFREQDDHLQCRLAEGGRAIFFINIRKILGGAPERSRANILSMQADRILRAEVIQTASGGGTSSRKENIEFTLGDHPIAAALRKLPLGRIMSYAYTPKSQAVLTSAIESYPAR